MSGRSVDGRPAIIIVIIILIIVIVHRRVHIFDWSNEKGRRRANEICELHHSIGHWTKLTCNAFVLDCQKPKLWVSLPRGRLRGILSFYARQLIKRKMNWLRVLLLPLFCHFTMKHYHKKAAILDGGRWGPCHPKVLRRPKQNSKVPFSINPLDAGATNAHDGPTRGRPAFSIFENLDRRRRPLQTESTDRALMPNPMPMISGRPSKYLTASTAWL